MNWTTKPSLSSQDMTIGVLHHLLNRSANPIVPSNARLISMRCLPQTSFQHTLISWKILLLTIVLLRNSPTIMMTRIKWTWMIMILALSMKPLPRHPSYHLAIYVALLPSHPNALLASVNTMSLCCALRPTLLMSLVDCGANGGVVGDDILVILKTSRTVDINSQSSSC